MEINQAIEEWLELCTCDNFSVKELQGIVGKFNRYTTNLVSFNYDAYTEPTDQEMMAAFGTKWHNGL